MLIRILLLLLLCGCCSPPPPTPPPSQTASATDLSDAPSSKEDIPPEAATGLRSVQAVGAGKWMTVAANPHASEAGAAMLRAGGSAVDAAIAMAAVLTLVEPQSSGIGGGAFLLHYQASNRELSAYDGRETAPKAATADMFLRGGRPRGYYDAVIGGLSVGVPGELRMLELAHKDHGKLPWKRLFEPAIQLADSGFKISQRLHKLLSSDRNAAKMKAFRDHFFTTDGSAKPVGSVLVNRELAAVFRAVAEDGADAFYEGQLARDIVAAVRGASRNPGRLTLADVKAYRPKKREPVCLRYRGHDVCGMPPPTSGGVTALQILALLERFEPVAADSVQAAHLFAEAGKLAYADRDMYIADPDFVAVPTGALLDPAYLRSRSQLIDPARALGKARAGAVSAGSAQRWAPDATAEQPSTSHMVAVDADGNAISMTASIESGFGSHILVRGFLLNNELTDFSFLPEVDGRKVANRVEPGKRPRSSMAPIIVLTPDRRFVLALGSPGGSRIISYVARALVDVLDRRLDLQSAISRPHVSNRNGPTEIERMQGQEEWLRRTKDGLEALGHRVHVRDLNSGLHGIMRIGDGYVGGVDPRREGVALGE